MEEQIKKVTQLAFFHLCQAKLLAPYLAPEHLATVIHATVTSRIGFRNALYAGLPLALIRKLQLVQNAAARVFTRTPWRVHIRPVLMQLLWLSLEFRIWFKVLVLTFKAIRGLGPWYLRDHLPACVPRRVLHSAQANRLKIPGPKEICLPASDFLGFGPGSRDPARPPSRRAGGKGARNRKKGWKRWRGPEAKLGRELGEWLDERAAEMRHLGGPVSEKPDDSLFFVDTGNEEKDRKQNRAKEKPLKVDLILQIDSKVPPPKDILAHQIPNGKKMKRKQRLWEKLAEKGKVPRKERLLQERLQKASAEKTASVEADSTTGPSRAFYDIWSDLNPLDQDLVGKDTWFLEQTKKQPVKRPGRLLKAPSELPAVEVVAPGGSYNPSFQAHQALLLQAHEIELKRQKAEEKLAGQLRFPTADEAPTQETIFQEQCEGLLEEDNSGDEEEVGGPSKSEEGEELQAGSGSTPPLPLTATGEKKTERQRKKEKEAKRLKARELSEKAGRLRRQEVFRLHSIRLQVKRWEAELLRRKRAREAKRKAEADKPKRLGRLKYEDPDLDLQLSTELAESLRTLKPEGSILKDRFKSLQKRNLIEPRERAKFKRKYRVKYVEKRAFRAITL